MKAAHNVPGYTGLQVENKTYIYIIQKIICYYYKRIYDIWCELLFCQMPAELTCCICDELTMRFGHRVTSWLSSLLCDMVIIHGQSGMYLVTKWHQMISQDNDDWWAECLRSIELWRVDRMMRRLRDELTGSHSASTIYMNNGKLILFLLLRTLLLFLAFS